MAKYWINQDGEQHGPYTLEELQQMQLTPNTYAWTSGMPRWQKAANIAELAPLVVAGNEATGATTPPPYQAAAVPPQYHGPGAVPPAMSGEAVPPCPPTNMVWAIVAIVLCCWIPAVVGLVMGLKVKSLHAMGQYDEAQKQSDRSAWWIIASVVLGILAVPFSMLSLLLQ